MIAQRPPGAAPAIRASAEALPLPDDAVDAGMAILTLHHWEDLEAGLRELRRVVRGRIVLLHWEPALTKKFWLVKEYLPVIAAWERDVPTPRRLGILLGEPVEVVPVPVPHDCTDGFLGAYWRRPEQYLDPAVRASISSLAALGDRAASGLLRLHGDLESGAWARRHADLLAREECDVGYRLVIASGP